MRECIGKVYQPHRFVVNPLGHVPDPVRITKGRQGAGVTLSRYEYFVPSA
jgi:hypothetical protein